MNGSNYKTVYKHTHTHTYTNTYRTYQTSVTYTQLVLGRRGWSVVVVNRLACETIFHRIRVPNLTYPYNLDVYFIPRRDNECSEPVAVARTWKLSVSVSVLSHITFKPPHVRRRICTTSPFTRIHDLRVIWNISNK